LKTAKNPPQKKRERPLRSLANIGTVTEKKLNQIGIFNAEDFLCRDPYRVFTELQKKVDPTLCRCALALIVGAKLGLPWHQVTKAAAREYEKRHPEHEWGPC